MDYAELVRQALRYGDMDEMLSRFRPGMRVQFGGRTVPIPPLRQQTTGIDNPNSPYRDPNLDPRWQQILQQPSDAQTMYDFLNPLRRR